MLRECACGRPILTDRAERCRACAKKLYHEQVRAGDRVRKSRTRLLAPSRWKTPVAAVVYVPPPGSLALQLLGADRARRTS